MDDNNTIKAEELRKRHYFAPGEAGRSAAQAYIGAVSGIEGIEVKWNFDSENPEIPDDHALMVQPVQRRNPEKGEAMLLDQIIVAHVPSIEAILAHEKGQSFVQGILEKQLGDKLKAALSADPIEFPSTLVGFIESTRKSESLETFNEISKPVLAFLKKQGLKHITKPMLKSLMQSASFAESQYEKIKQEQWVFVLDRMIDLSKEKDLDPSILEHWKATRDQVEVSIVDDVDFEEAFAGFAGD